MSDKKYEPPIDLDIPMDEVFKKVAKAKTEGIAGVADDADLAPPVVEGELQLALFKGKRIRQVFHNNEWFFSIVDVIEAVTESNNASRYWSELKKQLTETEGFAELFGNIEQLKMPANDGKSRETDAVNVETLFRIIQSVPSPKAEPFKKWLSKVGYERIQEFQDPEIAVKRAVFHWQVQGRTKDWIEARLRSIVVRNELTTEWAQRGVSEGIEYGMLTNIISKETFGVKTAEHKKLKGLTSQPLRDHMTDLELVFTMLGEKSTAAIAQSADAQGFQENANAAHSGGRVAGNARKGLERQLGRKIVSPDNFLKGNASDPKQLKK
jgi:hypothetical protein